MKLTLALVALLTLLSSNFLVEAFKHSRRIHEPSDLQRNHITVLAAGFGAKVDTQTTTVIKKGKKNIERQMKAFNALQKVKKKNE